MIELSSGKAQVYQILQIVPLSSYTRNRKTAHGTPANTTMLPAVGLLGQVGLQQEFVQ